MVNQEVILTPHLAAFKAQRKYLHQIHFTLCKTQYGLDFMNRIKEKYQYQFENVLVGHTTIFPKINISPSERDWSRILHPAGAHNWKNTDTVIKCWLEYGLKMKLPPIDIICHRKCLSSLRDYLNPSEYQKMLNHELINFRTEPLSFKDLVNLKYQIGIHLCPSMAEGFGHYINEGRITKSLVITTNLAPMNELIDSESGVLIDCYQIKEKTNGNHICFIETKELAKTIKKVEKMDLGEKERIGEQAFEKYQADRQFFQERIIDFAEMIQALLDKKQQKRSSKKKSSRRSSKKKSSRRSSKKRSSRRSIKRRKSSKRRIPSKSSKRS